MQNMFTHNPNYDNNRGVNLYNQKICKREISLKSSASNHCFYFMKVIIENIRFLTCENEIEHWVYVLNVRVMVVMSMMVMVLTIS